jgi:hypothetical protein
VIQLSGSDCLAMLQKWCTKEARFRTDFPGLIPKYSRLQTRNPVTAVLSSQICEKKEKNPSSCIDLSAIMSANEVL